MIISKIMMTFGRIIPRSVAASLGVACAWVFLQCSVHAAEADALTGKIFIHDPSTIVADQGRYYVYGTLPGMRVLSSPDLIHWQSEPAVLSRPPAWAKTVAPGFDGYIWAPDVIHVGEKFYLYYSVSAWGKQTSAISLLTSPTLNPAATNYAWTDGGRVIQSTNGSDFNTIDPSVMQDTDGKLWLAFGSYWKGIYLTELNPATGLRADTNVAPYHLAWNDSIEATCLMRHDQYYYLFVDWGQCCEGTNSTYEVRLGRSQKITGPYLDKAGNDMAAGGGSLFLAKDTRFFGPGHIGILQARGQEWISYHTYDAKFKGRSRLYIRQLDWTPDDWPVPGKPIEPQ